MKKSQKISIQDISRELGISITTISFIINKKAKNRISDEVIQRVEEYIKKVGYKPNSSAQTLRTGKSKTIVFMAEDISDPFFSAIAKEMEEVAYNNGYKILYCSTENNKQRAAELISLFRDRQVDAFIITPPEGMQKEITELIEENEHIVMLFDRRYSHINHHYVVLNNFKGALTATEYLIRNGRKHIAYVGLESDISPMTERHNGYLEAIRKKKLNAHSILLPFADVRTEKGRNILKRYLKEHSELDSVIFSTNGLAINGLHVLKDLGIRIPENMAVITFDDRELFLLHTPSITVLSQPVASLAKELIKGTLQLLRSKKEHPQPYQKMLEGELIIRDSSQ